ncbi:hypothetical protein DC3_38180 [Deinococcus cellulosilyticus NBRC 106333 = KACC 11606]|uniref:Uncharacterized protein n=1 Tax=Deinococcus cellulosilyticus (strain DSM 18568 / NBRC 106333 / KACC 11606 / 5516J-15) TaxID=1223518 RepID=A0A511N5Q7_DEIC1|nr:hypothetical protein DC3_38180 [Deinococcus cellulosilyticus NBRC 106333 = KACC 11606]
MTQVLNVTTITGTTGVGNDDAVVGVVLGTIARQTNFNHVLFLFWTRVRVGLFVAFAPAANLSKRSTYKCSKEGGL